MPLRRRVVEAVVDPDKMPCRGGVKVPRLVLWVDTFRGQGLDLLYHPVFRAAPLNDVFRERTSRLIDVHYKSVRLGRHDAPEAIILQLPDSFLRSWCGLAITSQREAAFTKLAHVAFGLNPWIGLLENKVWVSHDGRGDTGILGLYVNLLSGLDENGRKPRTPRQGTIPDDDEQVLGALAP